MLSNPVSGTLVLLKRGSESFVSRLVQQTTFQARPHCHLKFASLKCFTSVAFSRRYNRNRCVQHFSGFSCGNFYLSPCVHGCRNMTVLANFRSPRETIYLGARTRIGLAHKCFHSAAVTNSSAQLCRTLPCNFQAIDSVSFAESNSTRIHQRLCTALSHCKVMVRQKSGGKKSKHSDDNEDSDEEELNDDDYEAPVNFKKMKIYLKSLRADSVVSSALDISRNRVDEIFFGSRLRLNGEKLLKKSKQMGEGDYVDVIVERAADEDKLLVKRVKVIGVSSERTNKDKVAVTVKVWKSTFPVEDTSKSEWKS